MPKSKEEILKAIAGRTEYAIRMYKIQQFDIADDYAAVALGLYLALIDSVQDDFRSKYPNIFKLMKNKTKEWLAIVDIDKAIDEIKKLRLTL